MWEYCGMARTAEGLTKAKGLIQALKADFWKNAIVTGENEEVNASLERAGRVADFIELGELMVDDALMRKNHAVATSGLNRKQQMVKHCVMMKTSRL
jgi:succinate dehydrogenase / fumarate reductase flavoprotein subunit